MSKSTVRKRINHIILLVAMIALPGCYKNMRYIPHDKFLEEEEQYYHLEAVIEGPIMVSFASFDTLAYVATDELQDSAQKANGIAPCEEFVEHEKQLSKEIIEAVFRRYQKHYSEYRKTRPRKRKLSEQQLAKYVPPPSIPVKLKAFMTPRSIYIPRNAKCNDGTFGIEFYCTWDINGLGIIVKDWKVIEVGSWEIADLHRLPDLIDLPPIYYLGGIKEWYKIL